MVAVNRAGGWTSGKIGLLKDNSTRGESHRHRPVAKKRLRLGDVKDWRITAVF